jgi:hypothetical protein
MLPLLLVQPVQLLLVELAADGGVRLCPGRVLQGWMVLLVLVLLLLLLPGPP